MKCSLAAAIVALLPCLLIATDSPEDTRQQCVQTKPGNTISQEQLAREIRHELIALPHYSIFDNLDFRLEGTAVILLGQVTVPEIKASAEAAVKALGVTSINDRIE